MGLILRLNGMLPILPILSLKLRLRELANVSDSLNSSARLTGTSMETNSTPMLLENPALRRDGLQRRDSTPLTPRSTLTLTTTPWFSMQILSRWLLVRDTELL